MIHYAASSPRAITLLLCLALSINTGCFVKESPSGSQSGTSQHNESNRSESILRNDVKPSSDSKNSLTDGPDYLGMCDASAAVAINESQFIVANDEDNTLRLYSRSKGGMPLDSSDMSPFLKPNSKRPETDIEGAAQLGEYVFWITSHGRNRNGKIRPSRYRFFATKIKVTNDNLTVKGIGKPYEKLVRLMIDDPRFKKYKLAEASTIPPKSKGALNIEGLCATADRKLWIAFRNPIRQSQALIIPLANPLQVVQDKALPKFEDAIVIDLDNLGIRSMEYDPVSKQYLIVAGSYKSGGKSRLYQWSGKKNEKPKQMKSVDFAKLNPEAMFIYPDKSERHIQFLSDDGTRLIDGKACKSLSDEKKKVFRSRWLILK